MDGGRWQIGTSNGAELEQDEHGRVKFLSTSLRTSIIRAKSTKRFKDSLQNLQQGLFFCLKYENDVKKTRKVFVVSHLVLTNFEAKTVYAWSMQKQMKDMGAKPG